MTSKKEYWQINTERIADEIRAAAQDARTSAEDEQEAHYLCGILNSKVVDEYIRSFSSAGRGFGAPSVMSNLAIPKFNGDNKIHMKIVDLSQKGHGLVAQGKEIGKLRDDLNEAVERLWNIKS